MPEDCEVGPVGGGWGFLRGFGAGDEVEGGNADGGLCLHVAPPLFEVGGGGVVGIDERPARDVCHAGAEAHHLCNVAAGVPDIVEADDVGGFAEERVGGLRLDHRVGLPLVCFAVEDGLEAADEFDAGGRASKRQAGRCG